MISSYWSVGDTIIRWLGLDALSTSPVSTDEEIIIQETIPSLRVVQTAIEKSFDDLCEDGLFDLTGKIIDPTVNQKDIIPTEEVYQCTKEFLWEFLEGSDEQRLDLIIKDRDTAKAQGKPTEEYRIIGSSAPYLMRVMIDGLMHDRLGPERAKKFLCPEVKKNLGIKPNDADMWAISRNATLSKLKSRAKSLRRGNVIESVNAENVTKGRFLVEVGNFDFCIGNDFPVNNVGEKSNLQIVIDPASLTKDLSQLKIQIYSEDDQALQAIIDRGYKKFRFRPKQLPHFDYRVLILSHMATISDYIPTDPHHYFPLLDTFLKKHIPYPNWPKRVTDLFNHMLAPHHKTPLALALTVLDFEAKMPKNSLINPGKRITSDYQKNLFQQLWELLFSGRESIHPILALRVKEKMCAQRINAVFQLGCLASLALSSKLRHTYRIQLKSNADRPYFRIKLEDQEKTCHLILPYRCTSLISLLGKPRKLESADQRKALLELLKSCISPNMSADEVLETLGNRDYPLIEKSILEGYSDPLMPSDTQLNEMQNYAKECLNSGESYYILLGTCICFILLAFKNSIEVDRLLICNALPLLMEQDESLRTPAIYLSAVQLLYRTSSKYETSILNSLQVCLNSNDKSLEWVNAMTMTCYPLYCLYAFAAAISKKCNRSWQIACTALRYLGGQENIQSFLPQLLAKIDDSYTISSIVDLTWLLKSTHQYYPDDAYKLIPLFTHLPGIPYISEILTYCEWRVKFSPLSLLDAAKPVVSICKKWKASSIYTPEIENLLYTIGNLLKHSNQTNIQSLCRQIVKVLKEPTQTSSNYSTWNWLINFLINSNNSPPKKAKYIFRLLNGVENVDNATAKLCCHYLDTSEIFRKKIHLILATLDPNNPEDRVAIKEIITWIHTYKPELHLTYEEGKKIFTVLSTNSLSSLEVLEHLNNSKACPTLFEDSTLCSFYIPFTNLLLRQKSDFKQLIYWATILIKLTPIHLSQNDKQIWLNCVDQTARIALKNNEKDFAIETIVHEHFHPVNSERGKFWAIELANLINSTENSKQILLLDRFGTYLEPDQWELLWIFFAENSVKPDVIEKAYSIWLIKNPLPDVSEPLSNTPMTRKCLTALAKIESPNCLPYLLSYKRLEPVLLKIKPEERAAVCYHLLNVALQNHQQISMECFKYLHKWANKSQPTKEKQFEYNRNILNISLLNKIWCLAKCAIDELKTSRFALIKILLKHIDCWINSPEAPVDNIIIAFHEITNGTFYKDYANEIPRIYAWLLTLETQEPQIRDQAALQLLQILDENHINRTGTQEFLYRIAVQANEPQEYTNALETILKINTPDYIPNAILLLQKLLYSNRGDSFEKYFQQLLPHVTDLFYFYEQLVTIHSAPIELQRVQLSALAQLLNIIFIYKESNLETNQLTFQLFLHPYALISEHTAQVESILFDLEPLLDPKLVPILHLIVTRCTRRPPDLSDEELNACIYHLISILITQYPTLHRLSWELLKNSAIHFNIFQTEQQKEYYELLQTSIEDAIQTPEKSLEDLTQLLKLLVPNSSEFKQFLISYLERLKISIHDPKVLYSMLEGLYFLISQSTKELFVMAVTLLYAQGKGRIYSKKFIEFQLSEMTLFKSREDLFQAIPELFVNSFLPYLTKTFKDAIQTKQIKNIQRSFGLVYSYSECLHSAEIIHEAFDALIFIGVTLNNAKVMNNELVSFIKVASQFSSDTLFTPELCSKLAQKHWSTNRPLALYLLFLHILGQTEFVSLEQGKLTLQIGRDLLVWLTEKKYFVNEKDTLDKAHGELFFSPLAHHEEVNRDHMKSYIERPIHTYLIFENNILIEVIEKFLVRPTWFSFKLAYQYLSANRDLPDQWRAHALLIGCFKKLLKSDPAFAIETPYELIKTIFNASEVEVPYFTYLKICPADHSENDLFILHKLIDILLTHAERQDSWSKIRPEGDEENRFSSIIENTGLLIRILLYYKFYDEKTDQLLLVLKRYSSIFLKYSSWQRPEKCFGFLTHHTRHFLEVNCATIDQKRQWLKFVYSFFTELSQLGSSWAASSSVAMSRGEPIRVKYNSYFSEIIKVFPEDKDNNKFNTSKHFKLLQKVNAIHDSLQKNWPSIDAGIITPDNDTVLYRIKRITNL